MILGKSQKYYSNDPLVLVLLVHLLLSLTTGFLYNAAVLPRDNGNARTDRNRLLVALGLLVLFICLVYADRVSPGLFASSAGWRASVYAIRWVIFLSMVIVVAQFYGLTGGLPAWGLALAAVLLHDYVFTPGGFPASHLLELAIAGSIGFIAVWLIHAYESRTEGLLFQQQLLHQRINEQYANLKRSEERYRRIVETAQEGIWAVDGSFVTTFVNSKTCEMLGYTMDEMLGQPLQTFVSGEAGRGRDVLAQFRGRHGVRELPFRCKDGSTRWCQASVTVLSDENGLFAGSVSMLTDISERKHSERERDTTIELLHLVNSNQKTPELVRAFINLLRSQFDCQALGVRLAEGNDFPYYQTHGLPPEFVQEENSLSTQGNDDRR
jgi:PAS domain S-box-containing protein